MVKTTVLLNIKKVFFTFFLLMLSVYAKATVLIIVVTSKQIIIVEDSKSTPLMGGMPSEIKKKIDFYKGYYYAISGLNKNADNSFSVSKIIRNNIDLYPDFPLFCSNFPNNFLKETTNFLTANDPEIIDKLVKKGQGGDIYILGLYENKETVLVLHYIIKRSDTGITIPCWVNRFNREHIDSPDSCYFNVIGPTGFRPKMPSIPQFVKNPKKYAILLAKQAVADFPDRVGYPLTVLEVNDKGINVSTYK